MTKTNSSASDNTDIHGDGDGDGRGRSVLRWLHETDTAQMAVLAQYALEVGDGGWG